MPLTDTKGTREAKDVPFSFLVSLFRNISQISPRPSNVSKSSLRLNSTTASSSTPSYLDYPAANIFRSFIHELRTRFGDEHGELKPGTTLAIFRLLFPEEDKGRKFGMQERQLGEALGHVFGVSKESSGRGARLREWMGNAGKMGGDDGDGCLGKIVGDIVWESYPDDDAIGPLSVTELDELLSNLASRSIWSDDSFRHLPPSSTTSDRTPPQTRKQVIRTIYDSLPALDSSYLTQIILKDLRPLLYPAPAHGTTTALLGYKSDSVKMLSKEDAMRLWDGSGRLGKAFAIRGSFEEAVKVFEGGEEEAGTVRPVVGMNLQVPKCLKGQGCKHALKYFKHAETVYVETKYDGERVQLHYWLDEEGNPHIKMFSKSGRDSTLDRAALHPLIKETLKPNEKWKSSLILEAEMVAWSDELDRVDEFWRIRSLVESTAIGGRSVMRRKSVVQHPDSESQADSQASLLSNASDNGTRHLSLIFFDVLLIDSISLLSTPYMRRRALLEAIISPNSDLYRTPTPTPDAFKRSEHGDRRVMLADSVPIDMTRGIDEGARQLREVFAGRVAEFEEGVVLKDAESGWREPGRGWVKLKKDYIEGYGDCVDMVVLGAGWSKDRARELKVGSDTFTTLYLGLQSKGNDGPRAKPHFEMFMPVSYGMSREQLEEANCLLRAKDHTPWNKDKDKMERDLPYTFSCPKGLAPPLIMLHEPLLAEVFGAGFTKERGCKNYSLRFPRLTKLHRSADRPWTSAISMSEFDKIAHEAVGRESLKDQVAREVDGLWEKAMGKEGGDGREEGLRDPRRIERVKREWVRKLEAVDGVVRPSKEDDDDENEGDHTRRTVTVQGRPALGGYKTLGSMTNLSPYLAQVPQEIAELQATPIPLRHAGASPPSPPSSPPRMVLSPRRTINDSPATPRRVRTRDTENEALGSPTPTRGAASHANLQAPTSPKKVRPRRKESNNATRPTPMPSLAPSTAERGSHQETRLRPGTTSSNVLSVIRRGDESVGARSGLDGLAPGVVLRKRERPEDSDLKVTTSQSPKKKIKSLPETPSIPSSIGLKGEGATWKTPTVPESVMVQSLPSSSTSRPGLSSSIVENKQSSDQEPNPTSPLKAQATIVSASTSAPNQFAAPGPSASTTGLQSIAPNPSLPTSSLMSLSRASSILAEDTAPNKYTEQFSTFLSDAVIWFGCPSTSEDPATLVVQRPSWRRASEPIIPHTGRTVSLEILLLACGWGTASEIPGRHSKSAAKGVMFLDDTCVTGLDYKRYGLELLRKRMDESGGLESAILGRDERKVIWVFDMQILKKGLLERMGGDFMRYLIYKFA